MKKEAETKSDTEKGKPIAEKAKIQITKKTFAWIISLLILALIFSIISVTTIFCCHFVWNLEFVSQILVISFLGALATFVVISNYMQVADIKRELSKEIAQVKIQLPLVEQQIQRLNEAQHDTLIHELGNIREEYKAANSEEKKEIIFKKLFKYEDLQSYELRRNLLDCVKSLIVGGANITTNFSFNVYRLLISLMPIGLTDKQYIREFGDEINRISYGLTCMIFFAQRKTAPAKYSLLIMNHINRFNDIDLQEQIRYLYQKLEDEINHIQNKANNSESKNVFKYAQKLVKIFKEDLRNKRSDLPGIADKDLLKKIQEEEDS